MSINKSKALWNGRAYSPNQGRAAPFDGLSLALCSSLEPLMGSVGASEGTSHRHAGRLDGPFHLFHIHLHKQSLSHLHAPVLIPPSRVHSRALILLPFEVGPHKSFAGSQSQSTKWQKCRKQIKNASLPSHATSVLKKKNLFSPQSNEMCLETLKIKRLFIHSWQQTRGLGQSKDSKQHKVLALVYQPSPDWKPGK